MANKTLRINFTSEKPNKDPEATYIDLSMDSSSTTFAGKRHMKIDRLTDAIAVQNAMRNIFSWIPGERILDPEFGNSIRKFIYEGNTDLTAEKTVQEVQSLVNKYEPRVELDYVGRDENDVSLDDQRENNELDIRVVYHIKGLPSQKYSVSLIL